LVATRIGVTGHRLLAPHPELATAIDDALAAIELRRPAPWVLVSGFAEGADELVATLALVRGWELEALLPLRADDFVSDLERPVEFRRLLERATTVEAIEPAVERPECYRAQGFAMLDRCDELIALWNGGQARGPGGTGEIVAAARSQLLTLTWIEAGDVRDGAAREPVTHVEGLG
jgi:hypothetical protein